MIYYGLLLFFVLEYMRPGSYLPVLNLLHLNAHRAAVGDRGHAHLEGVRLATRRSSGDTNTRVLVAFMCLLFGRS